MLLLCLLKDTINQRHSVTLSVGYRNISQTLEAAHGLTNERPEVVMPIELDDTLGDSIAAAVKTLAETTGVDLVIPIANGGYVAKPAATGPAEYKIYQGTHNVSTISVAAFTRALPPILRK